MFDVGASLAPALHGANDRLGGAAAALADANAGGGSAEAAMTATARSEIFTEALMAALKARLAEIKTAAKS